MYVDGVVGVCVRLEASIEYLGLDFLLEDRIQ